ncbi:hypothetical protein vBBaMIFTN7_48 [Bordetella phage vB_BaM-IFTN7]|nr:hypothetical protein vBBaMIFTN3_46 [Bordetella phage vB_BaM-IFTN3]UOK17445.1 hypothetical protein vBBaMIFTN7_48 [Bordetella phage vB_BaM-IFTN7]
MTALQSTLFILCGLAAAYPMALAGDRAMAFLREAV